MQQVTVQEQVEHATLGWRFAAVLVDTVVLFGLLIIAMMVYILVLAAQGRIDPQDPAAVQALSQDLGVSDLTANVVVFGALFVYYAVLEGIFGASVGKLVFRMRVVMADGSRPTSGAVIVRNLVRIPEAWLLYIPAGISCLASGRRQRLGDHVARTVVVRRRLSVAGGGSTAGPPAPPVPAPPVYGQPVTPATPPGGAWASSPPAAPAVTTAPDTGEALAHLKTAALAARGAHLNYLRFSERELAAGTADPAAGYSEEYVGAWFTLADAVAALRAAWDAATAAAVAAGRTLDEACANQADLAHLLRELTPYASAETDEEIHAAFLAVARWEASAP
ncbi:MAG TPA: RDD family protein [Thermoleophilia bacterium]|nr:RDD family protein [Thermoleophilia bacterium]